MREPVELIAPIKDPLRDDRGGSSEWLGCAALNVPLAGQPSLLAARLVALGGIRVRLLPVNGDDESCLVMQDIEGNEFCLD